MSSTYERAPGSIRAQAQELIDKYHSRLNDAGVKIDYLFARAARDDNGDPVGSAIPEKSGFACPAYCRKLTMKDRCIRGFDVEIVLDGDEWGNWDKEYQDALLDHELTHIAVGKGVDDCGRPNIKMRDHDWELGVFDEVARRHGEHSFEMREMRKMQRESPVYFQTELSIVKEVAA